MVVIATAACLAAVYGLPAAQAQQAQNPNFGQRVEERVKQQIPGARQGQPARTDQNGQIIPRSGQVQAGYRGQPGVRMPSLTDWQIAEWLSVDNQGEVALAEIAEQQASDKDVKKFAQQMMDEHKELLQKLQRLKGVGRGEPRQGQPGQGQPGQGQPGQARPEGQVRQGQVPQRQPQQGQFQPGQIQPQQGRPQQGLDLVMLKHQLGEQCRQSASRELQRKDGSEFDKCYMGMQIGMHMQMLDTLKVMSRYASHELDQLIEEGEKTTESHLDHAKKIMASLEGRSDSSARSARRDTNDRSSDSSREDDSDT
jgi:predicted outer membrane protein